MGESFGIPEIIQYLSMMGLKTSHVDPEQDSVELTFNSDQGAWSLHIGLQQSGDIRKLLFMIPQVATLTEERRTACLEALLAVNYRISLGKFGLDLEDNEVRLEEIVPLANDSISFDQFQLVLSAMVQTFSLYGEMISHIVDDHLSPMEAIRLCESDIYPEFDEDGEESEDDLQATFPALPETPTPVLLRSDDEVPDFDLNQILAEVTHILEEGRK